MKEEEGQQSWFSLFFLYNELTQWDMANPASAHTAGSLDFRLQAMNMSFTVWHSVPIQKAAAERIAEEAFTSNWSESFGEEVDDITKPGESWEGRDIHSALSYTIVVYTIKIILYIKYTL